MARPLTVLDTTVLIDVLRGIPAAGEYLLGLERLLVASEVTRVEVIQGLRSNERDSAERLFRALRWIPVTESISRRAGDMGRRWRRSHAGLSVVDLIVAATAEEYGAELATANVRHYPMIPILEPPYRA